MTKAIFFDIDGTLISFDTHHVSDASAKAIDQLRTQGIKVFVATGRPKLLLGPLSHIRFDGYITLNGAYCFTADGVELYKDCISRADLERIITHDEALRIPYTYIEEDRWFINRVDETVTRLAEYFAVEIPEVRPITDSLQTDIFQLMGYFPDTQDEYIFSEVLQDSEPMRWHPEFTDIAAKGNNKRHGMELMCRHFGIDVKETMALGDGGNDLEMLRHAGIGVAMGNASAMLKENADYVTLSVNEDGVAHALHHFGLLNNN